MDSKSSNILIIGYGSIGKKHEKAFLSLGCHVDIYSRRDDKFANLVEALAKSKPSIVVVANQTSLHYKTLETVTANVESHCRILVEKPVFEKNYESYFNFNQDVFVAYNLRQDSLLLKLKNIIISHDVLSASIYCGQYLPTWRPDSDYRNSYSSSREQGGGVLRDLSHELDYIYWLFGRVESVCSYIGKLSSLEIDSEDTVSILAQTQQGLHISLSMNYIDHTPQRKIIVNTQKSTFILDFIKGELYENGTIIKSRSLEKNTYEKQASCLLQKQFKSLCSLKEGIETLKLIESIEKSSRLKTWVKN